MKKISAGKFKTDCFALIDEVNETGKPIIITRRGREIARLIPAERAPIKGKFLGRLQGVMEIVGDIESPAYPPEAWNCLK